MGGKRLAKVTNILTVKHPDQTAPPPSQSDLTAWEKLTGLILPVDYRCFLLNFNGGLIKPWLFRHSHPGGSKVDNGVMILDLLHEWDDVLSYSHLDADQSLRSIPPHHLQIGHDPGAGRLLLSLERGTYGNIVYWLASFDTWGTEGNHTIGFVAPSFTAFLQSLFDDGETRHGNWDVIVRKQMPKPFTPDVL